MIARLAAVVLAAVILAVMVLAVMAPGVAHAQPAPPPPDRASEIMQMQFNSRAGQPPARSMDGPRASTIYKHFNEAIGHVPAAAAASGSGQ